MEKMYNELASSVAVEEQRYALLSFLYITEMAEICHQKKVVGWYFFFAVCPELIGWCVCWWVTPGWMLEDEVIEK